MIVTADTAHHGQKLRSTTNSPYLSRSVKSTAGQMSSMSAIVGQRASAKRRSEPTAATTTIAA